MVDPRFRQVEDIYQQVINIPPGEREAFLDRHCGSNSTLKAEVLRLLVALDAEKADCLRTPAFGTKSDVETAQRARTPTHIGRYEIVRKIGEGGMGVVYEATQQSPHRTVALKVIRPMLGSERLQRRFRHEAEILGQLQHHGIAHIYEAGTDSLDGDEQPFIAMEFVIGKQLTTFVKDNDLGSRECITLMAEICDAVQHAHHKGVIHRDLKPANILVDESGHSKILDFGVALIASEDFQLTLAQTGVGQLVGTLPYMSPEQVVADSRDLDARTDVYSLGVILFEVLCGQQPHDLAACSIPEAIRIIREEEPSRLSSKNLLLRGDLDTIVAKALEKESDHRYLSAAEFAADLRRYLRDEPIVARPASIAYHFLKFARRNRALVAGAATTFFALLIGLVGMTWFAMRESNQREAAQRLPYRASMASAGAAIREYDCASARRSLEEDPVVYRGWEWHHLHNRLDESVMVIPFTGRPGTSTFDMGGDTLRFLSEVPPHGGGPTFLKAQDSF